MATATSGAVYGTADSWKKKFEKMGLTTVPSTFPGKPEFRVTIKEPVNIGKFTWSRIYLPYTLETGTYIFWQPTVILGHRRRKVTFERA